MFLPNVSDIEAFKSNVEYATSSVVTSFYQGNAPYFAYYLGYVAVTMEYLSRVLNSEDNTAPSHTLWQELCNSLSAL